MKRKMYRVVKKDFEEALVLLGYRKGGKLGEWRRSRFHLFTKEKSNRLILRIHEDLPSEYPPFHKAKYRGKALTAELNKIVDAYKKRRAAKT